MRLASAAPKEAAKARATRRGAWTSAVPTMRRMTRGIALTSTLPKSAPCGPRPTPIVGARGFATEKSVNGRILWNE
jgi:hypothetical protein